VLPDVFLRIEFGRTGRQPEQADVAGHPQPPAGLVPACAVQVGVDGFVLPDALDRVDAPTNAAALPQVALLRRVWARHCFCCERRSESA